jgi:hypothetical protein
VSKGDGTTAGVELVHVELEGLGAIESLASEGLVDLKDVDVTNRKLNTVEELGDGDSGSDTHDAGRNTGRDDLADLADDGKAVLDGNGAAGKDKGSSAVGQLRGVTGGGGAVSLESRLDAGQGLGSDTVTGAVVAVDGLAVDDNGGDLRVELAALLSGLRLLVRASGKGIQRGTGEVVPTSQTPFLFRLLFADSLSSNVLIGEAHGDETVRGD